MRVCGDGVVMMVCGDGVVMMVCGDGVVMMVCGDGVVMRVCGDGVVMRGAPAGVIKELHTWTGEVRVIGRTREGASGIQRISKPALDIKAMLECTLGY